VFKQPYRVRKFRIALYAVSKDSQVSERYVCVIGHVNTGNLTMNIADLCNLSSKRVDLRANIAEVYEMYNLFSFCDTLIRFAPHLTWTDTSDCLIRDSHWTDGPQ
jgi:hypothetical protein